MSVAQKMPVIENAKKAFLPSSHSIALKQGFLTFLWSCTLQAFWQMSMYSFSNSTDMHVSPIFFLRHR